MIDRDPDRMDRVVAEIRSANLDALSCTLPENVRMVTGYWPVIGVSIAIVDRDGGVSLLVPNDEEHLAKDSWADEVRTFEPGSLDSLTDASQAVLAPLRAVLRDRNLAGARIGSEGGPTYEAGSYVATHLYGATIADLLRQAGNPPTVVNAQESLLRLRETLSPRELEKLRAGCRVVQQAFVEAATEIRVGMRETEVAARFAERLSTDGTGFHGIERGGGFCWCMSGPNSAEAWFAYARSRSRALQRGDLALVHCNSYADGTWTDVTRTFSLGPPEERAQKIYAAIFEAREAAIDVVRPGATGSDVDLAARRVLEKHGFGNEYKHPTGHGTGLATINHNARPRIHPKSSDVLQTGATFNVEPAVYIDGYGGIRHCDIITVTATGAEVLTTFQSKLENLIVE